jgi:hypothetical protein
LKKKLLSREMDFLIRVARISRLIKVVNEVNWENGGTKRFCKD